MKNSFTNSVNHVLGLANIELNTLTAKRLESGRLRHYYDGISECDAVFPVPDGFVDAEHQELLQLAAKHDARFKTFLNCSDNNVSYSMDNDYYTSPDAEILYTIITRENPKVFLEVGSGNSTRIVRQSVIDNQLDTKIVSVDPDPRIDVESFCDESHRKKAEDFSPEWFSEKLDPGDILFIDSSHQVKPGSDVVFLLLRVLPLLKEGVIVHIHDIFLPYEYPKQWIVENMWNWNEQYLVQALLQAGAFKRVIWAAQYAFRTIDNFKAYFPNAPSQLKANSLWVVV